MHQQDWTANQHVMINITQNSIRESVYELVAHTMMMTCRLTDYHKPSTHHKPHTSSVRWKNKHKLKGNLWLNWKEAKEKNNYQFWHFVSTSWQLLPSLHHLNVFMSGVVNYPTIQCPLWLCVQQNQGCSFFITYSHIFCWQWLSGYNPSIPSNNSGNSGLQP